MKKYALFLFCIITLTSYATVWTVSNNPSSPGQYSSLQVAIDEASDGDTLFVIGSHQSYGSITINRQLTLIGAGYNPNNQNGLISEINEIDLDQYTDEWSNIHYGSGSTISGFKINKISNEDYYGGTDIDNITISRNEIGTIYAQVTGPQIINQWIITNNIVNG